MSISYDKSNMLKTPMAPDMIPGKPSDYNATDGGIYSSVPGYPKADDGVIKEIMFDQSGAFGDVKPAKE